MEDNGSLTRVAAFPIGIDPDRFTEALEMPEVKANIAQLLNRWGGGRMFVFCISLRMCPLLLVAKALQLAWRAPATWAHLPLAAYA